MKKGQTNSGFNFEIEDDKTDDWEILEKFREIDLGNVSLIVEVIKFILGDEQYLKLKEHVKEKEGKVSVSAMQKEIDDILNYNQETKN